MSRDAGLQKQLQAARTAAMARAEEQSNTESLPQSDLDEAECFVRLVIYMYAVQLKLGMGVMPDGMAVFIRLSVPTTSKDPHAGMVSFVVSDDTLGVLRKAVSAMEASAKSPFWKPDQFANRNVT